MSTLHEQALLPSTLQYCTRCPNCLADLCFPEAPTSYSFIRVTCPICGEHFSQDVPSNRAHYSCVNPEDNFRVNASGPAEPQDVRNVLSPAARRIVSLALNDPTSRPTTKWETELYKRQSQISAAAAIAVLAILPAEIVLALTGVIPWISLLLWPLFVALLLFWTLVASPAVFHSAWRNKPACQVTHLVVVDTDKATVHKLPFSVWFNISAAVTTDEFRVSSHGRAKGNLTRPLQPTCNPCGSRNGDAASFYEERPN